MPVETVLLFEHSDWDEANPYFAFCNFAWASVLQKLAQVAEETSR